MATLLLLSSTTRASDFQSHMEISCSFHQITDMKMEHEGFDEDEAFYADLRRQILLLTADDDDDDEDFQETRRKKGSNRTMMNSYSSGLQPGNYFNYWESEKHSSVPSWLVNMWRTGNGTGVFIPQAVKNSRHGRGRMNNQKRRVYKPVQRRQP